jgi:dihydrofolate reductase
LGTIKSQQKNQNINTKVITSMRKLKLQVQMTIDGYVAGVNGEMNWMTWNWDEELKQYVKELTDPVDCIVLGRKLAEGFIPYWAQVASETGNPEWAAGQNFTNTKKVVFTKTLHNSDPVKNRWNNTVLAKGDLVEEINSLKNQEGKDIITYGGAEFVSALINNDLVDEYHLFINPTAIGSGMTIFRKPGQFNLALERSTSFPCGIIVNQYSPKRN